MSLLHKTFQRFHKLPENIPVSHYRSWVLINYCFVMAAGVHILFFLLFALTGITPLVIYNIASIVIWLFAIYFNLTGSINIGMVLGNSEIVVHAWLATIIIGWNTGFHHHGLIMPVAVFLTPWTFAVKVTASAINLVLYILLNFFFQEFNPLMSIDQSMVNFFNYTNIPIFAFALAFVTYRYRSIVIEVEAKLEQEHQKTNMALNERNEILTHLNEELTEAADYVKSMLPKPIGKGSVKTDWRFYPSTALGGDAFGYHWIDEDHFAIYLLDVSGHGVGAALLSVSVMNALRSQTLPDTDFKDAKQVLEGLNLAFPGENNNHMFFTMWYGVYNSSTRELTYASGGHPPALLFGANAQGESKMTQLRTPNYVIGGMPEVNYEKQKCQVCESDRLYVFSDGVYEVEKPDGSMWRFQEFSDYMNEVNVENQPILDCLYQCATNLNQSDDFEDDFTIVEISFS